MKELFKLSVTLMIICVVAGAGLAAVYAKTKPIIDNRAQEDLLNAVKEVIPGASEIVQEEDDGTVYWVGKSGDKIVGYAMNVDAWGFGSNEPIRLMVGVDQDGKVSAVQVISAAETPGIGMKVKDSAFVGQFVGTDNPMGVDGITGATVSSNAVKNGVNTAMEYLLIVSGANAPQLPIDLSKVPDGQYQGSAQGFMEEITVQVTVSGGKITQVEILSQGDTPSIAGPALKGIPEAMVNQQKVEVDTVSGATFTSKGIIGAVRNALEATQE